MKKKIFWSVCAAAMMSVFAVRAQNTECCQKIPTCAEMGYNLSAPKGHGWFCTACPTDPKKFSCSEKPCPQGTSSSQNAVGSYSNTSAGRQYKVYCSSESYSGDIVCRETTPILVFVSDSVSTSDKTSVALAGCKGSSSGSGGDSLKIITAINDAAKDIRTAILSKY